MSEARLAALEARIVSLEAERPSPLRSPLAPMPTTPFPHYPPLTPIAPGPGIVPCTPTMPNPQIGDPIPPIWIATCQNPNPSEKAAEDLFPRRPVAIQLGDLCEGGWRGAEA